MCNNANLKTLYEENGLMCREYLDWRHKVILRWFVSLGAMFVLGKWLWDTGAANLIWVPAAGCSALSLILLLMDIGISQVLGINADVGQELEKRMADEYRWILHASEWMEIEIESNKQIYLACCLRINGNHCMCFCNLVCGYVLNFILEAIVSVTSGSINRNRQPTAKWDENNRDAP